MSNIAATPRVFFISFGGPSDNYHSAVRRIEHQARSCGMFTDVRGYTDADLRADERFWSRHAEFLTTKKRGYGYWLWKSYLALRHMEEKMEEGDVLAYADAGCVLYLESETAKDRVRHYIERVATHPSGMLVFEYKKYFEPEWTKMDLAIHLNAEHHMHMSSRHRMANVFLARKCAPALRMLLQWYETGCCYHLIDDSPSVTQNSSNFKQHRHDQSIFSLLSKIYEADTLGPEPEQKQAPICAERRRYA